MASLIVVFAIYIYMALTRLFIPYNDAQISIDEINGKLYANYHGNTLSGTLDPGPSAVSLNGEEKDVAIFCFYESLWTKYMNPIFSGHNTAHTEENIFYLGDTAEIDQIYYGEFDLDSNPDSYPIDYNTIISNSKMIWEK